MDEKSPDKLGFKGRMLIFTALEKTYGRECAFDIATKSDDHVLKLVAIKYHVVDRGTDAALPNDRPSMPQRDLASAHKYRLMQPDQSPPFPIVTRRRP